jgi:hypothetical protein
MCKVVNIKKSDYDVLIMRPTKWGNPFKTGIHGNLDKVLELYENYLINNKDLMDSLHELKGKRLGCCCKPNPCHGDILKKHVDNLFGSSEDSLFVPTKQSIMSRFKKT